jgi:hypothetical protein
MATPSFNTANATTNTASQTITLSSFSAGAGSNRFLEVWTGIGTGAAVAVPTSVVWGVKALTLRDSGQTAGSNFGHSKYFLKEADFPVGATGNIVATYANSHDEMGLAAMIHSDVDQTNPYRNASQTAEVDTNNNTASITVPSNSDDVVTAGIFACDPNGSLTGIASTTGTERADSGLIAGGYENLQICSISGAASVDVTWAISNTGTTDYAMLLADSLKGVGAAASIAPLAYYSYNQQ